MPERILKDQGDVAALGATLAASRMPVTISWAQGVDRSKQQNRLQWMWANEVATQLGDREAEDVQAEWKLCHGVPILRESSIAFRETYDRCLRPLPYEQKARLMRYAEIGITRLMTAPQMVRFLDAVMRECLQMGLELTQPDPDLAAYHSKLRRRAAA